MSFTHSEVSSRAGVVEYEPHVFGLALIVIGVVDGHCKAEPSVRSIFDKRGSRVHVTRRVVDDILVCTSYDDRGCRRLDAVCQCYDLGSSLRKRNDLQGKDGSTSSLLNLTKGVTRADAEDDVSGTGASGSKGESMMTAAEAGAEDTSSDGY